jgi:N4-(beta-N-acetylglucosaminyl)-L-asparaginase
LKRSNAKWLKWLFNNTHMLNRRSFLFTSAVSAAALALSSFTEKKKPKKTTSAKRYTGGLVLSTWNHGIAANEAAWLKLKEGGNATDMAENGVRVTENDIHNQSVGLSGMPDRDGHTTLDACIMDKLGRAGSVCFAEKIPNPVTIARLVMEKTPHVMIVGEGAQKLSLEHGIPLSDFVNPKTQEEYKKWLEKSEYKPIINVENHDTIGLLAMDAAGDLAGACTTSGLAFKMRGRVGDSPIIGAGLYVDNEIGAATCTGLGETVLRSCTSFLTVELMRNGATPQEACEEAIKRLYKINSFMKDEYQVGLLAVNTAGEVGAYALRPGFTYALCKEGKNVEVKSNSLLS